MGQASWTYDTAANGLGQLREVSDSVSGYRRSVSYDSLGRADVTGITPGAGADTYYEKQTYDGYGRSYQRFDAARTSKLWDGHVTEVHYNKYGYAHQWTDGVYQHSVPRATYRTITGLDAPRQRDRGETGRRSGADRAHVRGQDGPGSHHPQYDGVGLGAPGLRLHLGRAGQPDDPY